jgi:hypothetical protein
MKAGTDLGLIRSHETLRAEVERLTELNEKLVAAAKLGYDAAEGHIHAFVETPEDKADCLEEIEPIKQVLNEVKPDGEEL